MILRFISKSNFLKKIYFSQFGLTWVKHKIAPFNTFFDTEKSILDIGSGSCLVAYSLQQHGYQVTPLDIDQLSYSDKITPIVYDGEIIPFGDHSFDQAMILTVLHHTKNPESVLKEAKRVAKQILIIEDIYRNPFQKKLTLWMDQFVNHGYSPCPKTNKDDQGWKETFDKLELKLVHTSYKRVLLFFRQAYYVVETS